MDIRGFFGGGAPKRKPEASKEAASDEGAAKAGSGSQEKKARHQSPKKEKPTSPAPSKAKAPSPQKAVVKEESKKKRKAIGDSDEEDDGACPHGDACYRKNPDHIAKHHADKLAKAKSKVKEEEVVDGDDAKSPYFSKDAKASGDSNEASAAVAVASPDKKKARPTTTAGSSPDVQVKKEEKAPKATPKPAAKTPVKVEQKEDPGSEEKDAKRKEAAKAWFASQRSREGPPRKGEVEIPVGALNCLEGKTFVISGVLESLEREECQALIERYAGKVTSAVSGKTTYLVKGTDAGKSKTDKAEKLGTKIIDEPGLLDIIRATAPQPVVKKEAPAAAAAATGAGAGAGAGAMGGGAATATTTPAAAASTFGKVPAMRPDAPVATTAPRVAPTAAPYSQTELWADKYKPKSFADVVGNQAGCKQLGEWLRGWSVSGTDKKRMGGKDKKGDYYRAVLISGPPGIGKTTAAKLVCELQGVESIEFNASDVRNKAALAEKVVSITSNTSMRSFFGSSSQKVQKRTCLIMDECDGMSSGDRGGMSALIQIIKNTKIPVICICNDYWSKSVGSLKNSCMDLRWQKPHKSSVAKRLIEIVSNEGLAVPTPTAMEKLSEAAQGDIRHLLNLLQSFRLQSSTLSYDDVDNTLSKGGKESVTMQSSIFDVSADYFFDGSKNFAVRDRLDMYFQDYRLMGLMVQENYLRCTPHLSKKGGVNPEVEALERFAKASASISDMDINDSKIMESQNWSLLPASSALCVKTGFHIRGSPPRWGGFGAGSNAPSFPQVLGKMSTTGKKTRMLGEVQAEMLLRTTGNRMDIATLYLPVVQHYLTKPLLERGVDGVADVMTFMDEYFLSKDSYDIIIGQSSDVGIVSAYYPDSSAFKKIESKVKASLTRQYNATSHPVPFSKGNLKAKAAAASKASTKNLELEGEEYQDEYKEEENDDEKEDTGIAGDKTIKAKKPGAKGSAGGSKGKGSKGKGKGPAAGKK